MMESRDSDGSLAKTTTSPTGSSDGLDEFADGDEDSSSALEPVRLAPQEGSRPVKVIHHPIEVALLDADAVAIIHRLTRFEHGAYLVGGCVRDLLLHRKPKDFDVGTTARPRQVKRLFRNCRIIGRRFRLAHVFFGEKIIEVSTFRRGAIEPAESNRDDLLLTDENVFGTPEEDAFRRDFTVNGLFYDVETEDILDHVDGMSDVERRIIRTIGDPEVRLREDPVRILRAIKFAARLDFTIEPATLAAIERHREDILRSAKPRVLEEIMRLLRGGAAARSFELMRSTRVLEVVLPDVAAALAEVPDAWATMQAYQAALDRLIQSGVDVPAAVAFATLVAPFVDVVNTAMSHERDEWVAAFDKFSTTATAFATRIGLSRNDSGRLRQLAAAVRRLVPQTQKRRFTRASIARQPWFADGLAFFEIHATALGVFAEELLRWKEAAERVPPSAPNANRGRGRGNGAPVHGGSAPAEGQRRRRRRRGGRGRRRHGSAMPPGESPPPPAEP
jgi:poly(A) polymerase